MNIIQKKLQASLSMSDEFSLSNMVYESAKTLKEDQATLVQLIEHDIIIDRKFNID